MSVPTRRRWRALTLVAVASVPVGGLRAQATKTVFDHSVFWSKLEINEISERGHWGWGVDGIIRRRNELGQGTMVDQALRESVRPWVHYQFSPNARLSISPIGHFRTSEYVASDEDLSRPDYREWRSTIQFFHHQKQLKGRVMHTWRYRYEFRFQERPTQGDWRYFNRFRFRYRTRLALNSADFYRNNTVYLATSGELGINIGDDVVRNVFNQFRVYAGVGMRFATAARAEVRYVSQFRTRGSTGDFDHGQGLMVAFYIDQLSALGRRDIPQVRFFD